ncbi:MAG: tyrosine-type recombinase/integrase [Phycisphaerales bacterium]|nr:tyrosine-type recombinase/integrase [Hyphomonadaceae bacterium]
MRLNAAIPRYLSHCESERRLSPLSVTAYGADLRDFARTSKNLLVTEIGEEHLRCYLVELNHRAKASVATVRRRFATLQGFFKWAAADLDVDNPFNKWKPKLKRPKRLPRALMRTELSTLLEFAEDRSRRGSCAETTFLALTFLSATGLRVSELCALSLEDVAPDGASLRVRGKGSRDRMVFISNEWLAREIAELRRQRARKGTGAANLFVSRHGGRMQPSSLRGRLKRLSQSGGATRKVTPHMLRHTAATLLIEEGVDIRIVQRLLGHASIATTEIYTHVADEALKRSLARADVIGRVVRKARS